MRPLLLLLLLLSQGCVLRALAIGGPEARGIRIYDRRTGRVTNYGLRYEAPPARAPVVAKAAPSPIAQHVRTGKLSTRVMLRGGHLQLIGLPARSQHEVVVAFRPVGRLSEGCALRMYRDSVRVETGAQQRRTDRELLVTVPVDHLGPSRRFAGEACGHSFELDEAGRDTIANFVATFHDRVAATVDGLTQRHTAVAD